MFNLDEIAPLGAPGVAESTRPQFGPPAEEWMRVAVEEPFPTYLARKQRGEIGSGAVKAARDAPTPFHFHHALHSTRKTTATQTYGEALGQAILDPPTWARYDVVVTPEAPRSTKAGVAALIDFYGLAPCAEDAKLPEMKQKVERHEAKLKQLGAIFLTTDQKASLDDAMRVIDNDTKALREIRRVCRAERTFTAKVCGHDCHVRPDGLASINGKPLIFSIKHTRHPTVDLFKRDYFQLGYDVSETFYQLVIAEALGVPLADVETFMLVCMGGDSSSTPNTYALLHLKQIKTEQAVTEVVTLLDRVTQMLEAGADSSYADLTEDGVITVADM